MTLTMIDLVGPKGYIHGWIFVGVPAIGAKVNIPGHGRGTVKRGNATHAHVKMADGKIAKVPHDKGPGKAKLVPSPKPIEKMSDDRAEMGRQARASIAKGGETLFHGTRHEFKPGDIIDAKFSRAGVTRLHEGKQYAFASTDPGEATFAGGAGDSAGKGHVYRVEPVGKYEWDPHQGSSTSRRTGGGFRVVEEVNKWDGGKLAPKSGPDLTQKGALDHVTNEQRLAILKQMSPAEKKAYVKTSMLPSHVSLSNAVDLARPGSYRPPAVPPYRPTGTMRKATAASMRKLADDLKQRHPDMGAHLHVQDAARALDRNQPEAANRHLTAAVGNMTPQSLRRHGLLTDEHHDAAKRSMDAVHRHMLLVKDIIDTQQSNNALPRNEQDEPQGPKAPVDDNLDEHPTARGPNEKAMNAPAKQNTGRIDIVVSKGQQTDSAATKQVAASNGDLTTSIELVGPKGYEHGWIYKGGPGLPPPKAKALRAPGREDPKSVIGVGGGRKNWENEASQMPDRGARHDFPAIAERMRQITPERVQQAREDDTRIGNGLAPLHPELAQIWPDVYGKHPATGKLATPKAPRIKKDPLSVTGLDSPSVSYLKAAVHQQMRGSGIMASNNGDLTTALELSAQTGALASTSHPFGKPGGPGLWGVKGMELPPYVQNIAHALLRTGRAKDEGEAIAMARAATKRWKSGKNTSPEVRAASTASDADWRAKQARAHAHANDSAGAIEMGLKSWINESRGAGGEWIGGMGPPSKGDVAADLLSRALHVKTPSERFDSQMAKRSRKMHDPKAVARAIRRQSVRNSILGERGPKRGLGPKDLEAANNAQTALYIELVGTAAGAAQDSRTPLGTFGSGGSAPAGKTSKNTSSSSGARTTKGGQQKAAAHPSSNAGKKAGLLKQAAGYRAQADALIAKRDAMRKALASASGATSSGQSGSTTSAGASTTKSTAPATTASSASTTSASSTTPSSTSTTPSTASKTSTTASTSSASAAQLKSQIAQLNTQILGLQAKYKAAIAQAKAL